MPLQAQSVIRHAYQTLSDRCLDGCPACYVEGLRVEKDRLEAEVERLRKHLGDAVRAGLLDGRWASVSDAFAELEAEVERLRAELDATREWVAQARAEEREAIIDLVGRQFGEDLGWGTAQNLVDRICARGDTTGGE